jgi:N6-L-threonylcarbamoyladenine synthase
MIVLGIESSCDETGIAIYASEHGLLTHTLHSQAALHADYGGVVPELASRDHLQRMTPLTKECLEKAGMNLHDLDAIAYTAGPGLAGTLLIGATFAHGLALALNIPAIGVHHLEAHLVAPFLSQPTPNYPFVCLLVSGGHTMLVEVQAFGHYTLLGETIDDAAGEAFDKAAQILGLGYPGGPQLAKMAEQGNPVINLPRPLCHEGLDFSFSGLKTAFVLEAQKNTWAVADLAASLEEAIVDILTIKAQRALVATKFSQLVVAGGVSANRKLRQRLQASLPGIEIFFPALQFCTDNGAMVALLGVMALQAKRSPSKFGVYPRWPLTEPVFPALDHALQVATMPVN